MDNNNTHGASIILGENISVFIDGIPDDCEHDYSGDTVFVSRSGKIIKWHTYKQWASYTAQNRSNLIREYHDKIDDPIVEGFVTCKKCKKGFSPPDF